MSRPMPRPKSFRYLPSESFARKPYKPLKTLKSTMGRPYNGLAWIWGWRPIRLASAPGLLGVILDGAPPFRLHAGEASGLPFSTT